MTSDIAFSDYLEIRNLIFEWAESHDTKDLDRMQRILGPASPVTKVERESLDGEPTKEGTPDSSVDVGSGVMGDARIGTQYHLGAARWDSLVDGTIQVEHQVRAAHQRYDAEDTNRIVSLQHAHGTVQHVCKKIDGAWKLVGFKLKVDWVEYDLFGAYKYEEA